LTGSRKEYGSNSRTKNRLSLRRLVLPSDVAFAWQPRQRLLLFCPDDHATMPGWFKGMEQIIRERNLWKQGLLALCPGFKCEKGATNCCCRRILFNQPDFGNQKSALQELIERRGHLCDFYPKFHCELNFIEMYWGAVKFRYRKTPTTSNIDEMEANVKKCLDEVPDVSMIRFANRAARFISAHAAGFTGMDLGYIKPEYKSHRMLPASAIREMKVAAINK
jgi:hypothetical protein